MPQLYKLYPISRGGEQVPRIIDLSVALGAPTGSVIPGHPSVIKEPIHTHERHGRSNTKITFSIHTATHVDAPYHFYPEGLTVDQVALEKFMGPAVRVDLRQVAEPRTPITVLDLETMGLDRRSIGGKIVIFHTGWLEAMYGKPGYYGNNPYLAEETARWLVDRGIRALAVDHTVDRGDIAAEAQPGDCPIHRILLGAGIPLMENLVNLDQLPEEGFQVIALPVKIYAGDGAPARIVAVLE